MVDSWKGLSLTFPVVFQRLEPSALVAAQAFFELILNHYALPLVDFNSVAQFDSENLQRLVHFMWLGSQWEQAPG